MRLQLTHVISRVVLVAAAIGILSINAVAHHGWGGYLTKEFEISGTVSTPLAVAAPHATMKIKADGQTWDLTLAPPAPTITSGIREANIPVGATITVHGHRNVNPKVFEIKTERITYNGKTYNVYPDRT